MPLLPVSAVIPTLNRRDRLRRTIAGLLQQEAVPAEIVVVDASTPPVTDAELRALGRPDDPAPRFVCRPAMQRGAAAQRNEGVACATQPFILFADDDIDLHPGCIETLWRTLQADSRLGACGAVIVNQHYHPPGRLMRTVFGWLGCPRDGSLAGLCAGPALNFLPAPEGRPPDDSVDWLNLCCTLVRREALPQPPLLPFFRGYSLMEDAALTIEIGRRWRLAAPAAARIHHDVQPASYKDRALARERMEVVNRWFVMRRIMGHDSPGWDLRQLALQLFMLAVSLRSLAGWRRLPAAAAGKLAGLATVCLHGHRWRGY